MYSDESITRKVLLRLIDPESSKSKKVTTSFLLIYLPVYIEINYSSEERVWFIKIEIETGERAEEEREPFGKLIKNGRSCPDLRHEIRDISSSYTYTCRDLCLL